MAARRGGTQHVVEVEGNVLRVTKWLRLDIWDIGWWYNETKSASNMLRASLEAPLQAQLKTASRPTSATRPLAGDACCSLSRWHASSRNGRRRAYRGCRERTSRPTRAPRCLGSLGTIIYALCSFLAYSRARSRHLESNCRTPAGKSAPNRPCETL